MCYRCRPEISTIGHNRILEKDSPLNPASGLVCADAIASTKLPRSAVAFSHPVAGGAA